MSSELTRVHQRCLGIAKPRYSRPDAVTILPKRMHFAPEVRKTIFDQLYSTGLVRGGPLFGHTLDGVVTVVAAPLGGYRILQPDLATDPLAFDERYVLGWVDALNFTSEVAIDWVGNWVMWPNSELGSLEDELAWLRRGRKTDLFSERHCLCSLGWADGTLSTRTYTWGPFEEEIGILSTNL